MSDMMQFPNNDQQQWDDVASDLKRLLTEGLGATSQEVKILLGNLRPRWERIQQASSFPTADQLQTIKDANDDNGQQAYVAAITDHIKIKDRQAIYEIAELEFRLLRRGRGALRTKA